MGDSYINACQCSGETISPWLACNPQIKGGSEPGIALSYNSSIELK